VCERESERDREEQKESQRQREKEKESQRRRKKERESLMKKKFPVLNNNSKLKWFFNRIKNKSLIS
jgi:hypothetical protein